MKAARYAVLLACAAATLVALPAAAGTKPAYFVKPKGLHLRLALPASNGYSASLRTNGHRQVILSVSKDDFIARYTALGKVTRKGIEADFDSFGQVSLRFRSKARFHPQLIPGLRLPPFLRDDCKGRRAVGESGLFRGNIRFRGEHGYVKVRARRVKGKVVRTYRRVCKEPSRAGASKAKLREEGAVFSATAQKEGVIRYLLATELSFSVKKERASVTFAFSGIQQKIGRVAVDKLLLVIDDFDSIRPSPVGEKPVTAEVRMPDPFSGTGSYLEEGKAPPIWSGDLALRLPGSGLVPLVGPEFEAELCRGDDSPSFERCLGALLEDNPLAQGSGSHSQPLALARLSSLR